MDLVALLHAVKTDATASKEFVASLSTARTKRGIEESWLEKNRLRATRDMAIRHNAIGNPKKLAYLMRRMGLSLNDVVRYAASPWHTLPAGAMVRIVVGDHAHRDGRRDQRFVAAPDLKAASEVRTFISNVVDRADICEVPRSEWMEGADPSVAAVAYIGSPVVNPTVNDVMESRMGTEALPARLRFHASVPIDRGALSFATKYPYGREGISFEEAEKAPLLYRLRENQGGKFADCAVLFVDVRTKPFVAVCAGHGGDGTMAAAVALSQVHESVMIDPRINLLGYDDDDRIFALVSCGTPNPSGHGRKTWRFEAPS